MILHDLALSAVIAGATATDSLTLERVMVTGNRVAQPVAESVFSIDRIDAEEISLVGAAHPSGIFARVPGTWISRGSGQEHLSAIRSPVLAGAGACGAFLFLEDGIPVRPAGFCNVNQLFEINTEQADAIEVLRGPGSALYGSNALHGVINVLHDLPPPGRHTQAALALGEFGFRRFGLDHGEGDAAGGWSAKYFGETADSIQVDAGHEQHKLNLGWYGNEWRAHLAATRLNQDTAGFITGADAWRDPERRRDNPNPEAFRDAESLRAWLVWTRQMDDEQRIELRPFARYSEMAFLQHFLPGKPLEENGQRSAGVLASFALHAGDAQWLFGLDTEWAAGWLRETQADPITEGPDSLRETRPVGRHYDYEVVQHAVSPWANLTYAFDEHTALVAGLRADWIRYDYDNLMLTGNTREDGNACRAGGCLFNRPADRDDSFEFLSPKLGLRHHLDERFVVYGNLVRGFRAPQATELYRLQRGQDVANLDPERIDSIEAGLRGGHVRLNYDIAVFAMRKRGAIFRDAEGFNVSSGRTRHRGVEFDVEWRLAADWLLALHGTYARHTYAFDYSPPPQGPPQGESFVNGRDVDTAPRVLGGVLARWAPSPATIIELEYQHVGDYFLDAENTQRYPGHGLWHWRWGQRFGDFETRLRVSNVLDADYAERADHAFGEFRYFPGWLRHTVLEIAYDFR